jgi:hypothetical protein
VKEIRMSSISVYYRLGSVFIVPQFGITDVGPVFIAKLNESDIAAALRNALAVNPADHVVPATGADYRSPVFAAMNVESTGAFERGLKQGALRFDEHEFSFFRFVGVPKVALGFRREDDPAFTLPANAPASAVAAEIVFDVELKLARCRG